jgi:hypothetical protein
MSHPLDWVKNGEMNGTNEGVMRSLFQSLPTKGYMDSKDLLEYATARDYMAELWLRGVSRDEFVKWAKENNL